LYLREFVFSVFMTMIAEAVHQTVLPMMTEAVKAGHHVLTQLPYTVIRASTSIRLPRADRWELQTPMQAAIYSH
jgi:hypothetical protein